MLLKSRHQKTIAGILLIFQVTGSVAGCGASSAEMTTEVSEPSNTGGSVQLYYQVPDQIPNILVDQVGYGASSEKAVIFRGEGLSGKFSVCDLETGNVVFTGDIEKSGLDQELGEYDSVGYFNDFRDEGNYYIYADVVGESFSFAIKEDAYREVLDTACKNYYINRCGIALSETYAGENAHSACHTAKAHLQEDPGQEIDVTGGWHLDETAGRYTATGSNVADNLLLAYEMNPSAFTDETGIPESGNGTPDILDEVRYEADWLLKMQDQVTGGEYDAAITDTAAGGDAFTAPVTVTPVSMDATISFASMMARFSYVYQQYDEEYATTCLKAADRAFTCFLNNQKATDNTAAFKAAAQLFRATGSDSYHQILKEFFAKEDFGELFDTDENIFLGSITYLSITQEVDFDQCGILMKELMGRSEGIASASSRSSYLVTDSTAAGNFDRLLDDMRCLTITDHIIYNHEYTTIIENHAHFLMGMNPGAVNYVTGDTERTYSDIGALGVMNDPEQDALLIIMLSLLEK
jgi:endoglucanase